MLRQAQEASERFAAEENIEVSWERIWSIEPILFDATLIDFCDEACREVAGVSHRLPSGPLHDAAEVARAGVPTVMMFVQSLRGLSHTKLEDTLDEHIELAVAALDRLADKTIARVSTETSPATIAAGLVLGAAVTWNISNVGAIATVESESYGVSLATVGLLTTALFVTHLAVQIPGGRLIDRVGARNVGLVALVIVAAGNAIALTSPTLGVGLGGRALMGVGTGVGFVAGIDLVRAGLGGPFWQGAYGGSTMAAAGLALMVIPQLVGELGWRAPFWTGSSLALVGLLPVLAARRTTPARAAGGTRPAVTNRRHRDRGLWPLAAVQMASFGLSVVAGNWIVTLLEREGHGRSIAGVVGGLILFAGVVTRPAGGLLMRRAPERAWALVATALVAGSTGVLVLAAAPPLWFGAIAALVVGPLGRSSLRAGLQHDASPPARRARRRDRIRERIGGSRHSRRHTARRPDLRHARGRPAGLPHHRPALGVGAPRRPEGGAVVR